MDNFLHLFSIQGLLFIYILIGIYARKISIITKENQQKFIDFILRIAMPCMIFNSFRQEITIDIINKAGIIIAISFFVCFTALLLGKIFYRKYSFEKRSIMQYGTLINNAGFAGLPLSREVFGDIGLFYAAFYLIPIRIFMWTAGISLFTQTDRKTQWKNVILNPNIIAIELGLIRSILHIKLPYTLNYGIENIGNCVTPISMMVVGAILADVKIKTIFEKSVFFIAGIRLILLPLITLGVISMFRLNSTISGVTLLLTAMPVGTTTALLAAKYNADVDFASKCVFVTTILSLITVPLIMLLLS